MMIYECLMPMLMLCKSSYARLTPEVLQRPALALACSLPHLSSPHGPLVTGLVSLSPFLSPSLGHGPSRSPAACVWPAQQQKPPAHLLTLSATLAPLSSTPIGGAALSALSSTFGRDPPGLHRRRSGVRAHPDVVPCRAAHAALSHKS